MITKAEKEKIEKKFQEQSSPLDDAIRYLKLTIHKVKHHLNDLERTLENLENEEKRWKEEQ